VGGVAALIDRSAEYTHDATTRMSDITTHASRHDSAETAALTGVSASTEAANEGWLAIDTTTAVSRLRHMDDG
jgi:hypothetical protein